MKNAEWRAFEIAVAAFAAAMDPHASVKHDVKLPDRHSGCSRQRDVWIEARICKHFPVTVLVSCKRLRKKLDESHIDSFNGEFLSSRAHKGVIYSYSGFTEPALKKARELGFCCCKLYRDEPPDLPERLTLEMHHCRSQVSLTVSNSEVAEHGISKWRELFSIESTTEGRTTTLLDELVAYFQEEERSVAEQFDQTSNKVPRPFSVSITVDEVEPSITVTANCTWDFYRAKLDAYLLNGSYSFTTGEFAGQIAFPSIDRLSSNPGIGWERLEAPPTDLSRSHLLMLFHGDMKSALISHLAEKQITGESLTDSSSH